MQGALMATNPKTGSEEFGELLRRGRERLGMSRRDLVEATGLSYPYISQLETGYRQPSPAAIQKLADALQLSLDDLFSAMAKGRRDDRDYRDDRDELSMNAVPERTSSWVRNADFSGAGGGPPAAPRPVAFGRRVAAAMPSSRPMEVLAHGDIQPETAPLQVEHYLEAPARHEIDADAVVEQAADLITALPAAIRLGTLARLQAEVVQSVIHDGIRDGLAES
jgi:transcriptional regulator with XRE-family HTH domain